MKKRRYSPTNACTRPKTMFLVAYEQPSGAIKVVRNRIQLLWLEPAPKSVDELAKTIATQTGCNKFIVELHHHRSRKIETRGWPAGDFWGLLTNL